MMMPANFSAISENEMTYVVGGAALEDILAPQLTVANWKTFNTNMLTLIGNHYVKGYVNNTLGVLFGGDYTPGDMIGGWKKSMGAMAEKNGVSEDWTFNSAASYAKAGLNIGLNIVGNMAAIYNLATGSVKNNLPTSF